MEKLVPLWKISKKLKKIGAHWQEYGSSLKNSLPPNFNNSFHLQKKIRNKTIVKKQTKTSFPRFQYVLVKWKLLPQVAFDCFLRKWKKMVSTSPKISFN